MICCCYLGRGFAYISCSHACMVPRISSLVLYTIASIRVVVVGYQGVLFHLAYWLLQLVYGRLGKFSIKHGEYWPTNFREGCSETRDGKLADFLFSPFLRPSFSRGHGSLVACVCQVPNGTGTHRLRSRRWLNRVIPRGIDQWEGITHRVHVLRAVP